MSSDCFFGISCIIHTVPRLEGSLPDTTFGNYGCVRLASLGRARCVAVLSSRTNVGNYLHTFVLGKKPSHTGVVDPGKLNERTLIIDSFNCCEGPR